MPVSSPHVASIMVAFIASGAFAQARPTLQYAAPANFYHSASTFPDEFSSQEVNAGIQIYQFRPLSGDFQALFRQGLLRDLIDPQFREANVSSQPAITQANIPGAEQGLVARFYETVAGLPRPHMRVALFANGAVAIADLSANNDASWQRVWPALQATLVSLKVLAPNAEMAVGTPDARANASAVSGLFMGTKPKYMVDLQRGVGYGRSVVASHWYLFSGDGRVHRGYDDPVAPNGDLRRFDFEAARRSDPDNAGSYTVQGNQLIIEMGAQQTERISVPFEKNRVVINSVMYVKR